tara:strand:+ start:397 stop:744 length:348 start_codon:yes stop_codon:yes gene_type:complete
MDDLSALLFVVVSISLLAGAVWLIVSAANSRPVRDFNAGRLTGEWSTEVIKPVHPEMKDVEPGTKLLGVNFEQKTECDLEEYRDLQARIEALRLELEGEDEEDDDDGGDVVISRK